MEKENNILTNKKIGAESIEWGNKEGWLPYKRNFREWFLYKIIGLYGYKLCYGDDTDILFLIPKRQWEN